MKPPRNPASGVLLVDKPAGITSHDVVARARRSIGTRKVGHAGTLDPMATGLLVLGVNSSTRLLTFVVGLEKEYIATIRLGASSTTDDAEGELGLTADAQLLNGVSDDAIAAGMASLTGVISQRPSSVSAIRVAGRRAYDLVRSGEEVDLPERDVTVNTFELRDTRRGTFIDLDVRVECSSGTYIRALARDLGAALGVGGHLTVLRRTRIGDFRVGDAVDPDGELTGSMMMPAVVARLLFPSIEVDAGVAEDLVHGKRPAVPAQPGAGPVAVIAPNGRLVGLVEIVDGRARVLVNFPPDEPTGEHTPEGATQ